MTLTEAKRIAKSPADYTTEQLDDAMTFILDSDRLSETQVTNLLAGIDREMRARIDAASKSETATYPEETRIGDIATFDRSTKVQFTCTKHDIGEWLSKDPFISSWFPAWNNVDPFGNAKHDANVCDCPTGSLVTRAPYPVAGH